MLYLVAVVYLANMCGLCTVDYEVSPLSHILCKYGFNDILSVPPLPTQLYRRYRNSHLLSLVNITQPPSHSADLVLMFSKDQTSLSSLVSDWRFMVPTQSYNYRVLQYIAVSLNIAAAKLADIRCIIN